MRNTPSPITRGRDQLSVSARSARPAATSISESAPAAFEIPSARAVTSPTRSANRRSSSATALSAACEILVSSSPSSTVVKRVALAVDWRWMKRLSAFTLSCCVVVASTK